jgi:FkbM family methyltransferase
LARVAAWQIRSRLAGRRAVEVDWIGGAKLMVKRGDHGLTANVYFGLGDFHEMAMVLHLLRPGDLFVDVGANLGSYTILAAKVAGADVVAFEPHPESYARLMENLTANGVAQRSEAVQAAVGEAPGCLKFTGTGTMAHIAGPDEQAAGCINVPVVTLDERLGGREPTMIKIDVEGYESAVLAGASVALCSPRLRVLIVELLGAGARYGADESRIERKMADLGFEACDYDPVRRTLTPPGVMSNNNIYVRDKEAVASRLAEAPIYNVFGIKF